MRRMSYWFIAIGVLSCTWASIWDVTPFKWLLSAVYLILVGKYFGITFRTDEVKGTYLKSPDRPLNILNMRKAK